MFLLYLLLHIVCWLAVVLQYHVPMPRVYAVLRINGALFVLHRLVSDNNEPMKWNKKTKFIYNQISFRLVEVLIKFSSELFFCVFHFAIESFCIEFFFSIISRVILPINELYGKKTTERTKIHLTLMKR